MKRKSRLLIDPPEHVHKPIHLDRTAKLYVYGEEIGSVTEEEVPEYEQDPVGFTAKKAGVTREELESYLQSAEEWRTEMLSRVRHESELQFLEDASADYVYLIEAEGSGRYKIGRSRNPEKRLSELARQSTFPLSLAGTIRCKDSASLERFLHERYSEFRVYGEWFQLPQSAVNEFRSMKAEPKVNDSWEEW